MDCIIKYWSNLLDNKEFLHGVITWMGTIFPVYVFVICSKFTFKDIGQEIRNNRWLLLKVLLVASMLVPLIAAGIVKIFHGPLVLGGIMLIASTAAGDPFDLVDARGKKGSLLMASVVMMLLVLVMPLTVHCWMRVFSQWFPLHLSASPVNIFTKVSLVVLPPMIAGLLLRQLLPDLAEKLAGILHKYFIVSALTIAIFFFPSAVKAIIFKFGLTGIAAMGIVTTLTLFAGYYAVGGSNRKDRISIALACSLGNMVAVLFIVHHCYPKLDMDVFLITVLGWVVLRWVIIWFWYFFMKFRLARRGELLT